MKVTKSIMALSALLLCVPVRAENGAVSFAKDLAILVGTPFVALTKMVGSLLISQAKQHPKVLCLTASAAALVYGTKVSYDSLMHARSVVHSVEKELNTMQSVGNQIVPEEIESLNPRGQIQVLRTDRPQELIHAFISYLKEVLRLERTEDLKKLGICQCPPHTIVARFDNAFEQRKIELNDLRASLATCKHAGKRYYQSNIEDLSNRLDYELRRTDCLQVIFTHEYSDYITQELALFPKFPSRCNKRYCMNKQRSSICDGMSPAYGCPNCNPQS